MSRIDDDPLTLGDVTAETEPVEGATGFAFAALAESGAKIRAGQSGCPAGRFQGYSRSRRLTESGLVDGELDGTDSGTSAEVVL